MAISTQIIKEADTDSKPIIIDFGLEVSFFTAKVTGNDAVRIFTQKNATEFNEKGILIEKEDPERRFDVRHQKVKVVSKNKSYIELTGYPDPPESSASVSIPGTIDANITNQPIAVTGNFTPPDNQDVTITNTPLPVNVQNIVGVDDTIPIDVQVNNVVDVDIDDSTPLDVNVTNQISVPEPLDVNITGQPILVNNDQPIDVNVTSNFNYDIALGNTDNITIPIIGRNEDVDISNLEDVVNQGGIYPGFLTTAQNIEVLSNDNSDTAAGTGARTVVLFGLDSSYNFQQEEVTLSGTTPVASVNQWLRVFFVRVKTAGRQQINDGNITVRTTGGTILAVAPAEWGQSQQCIFTIPDGYYGLLSQFQCQVNDRQAAIYIMIRPFGEVFTRRYPAQLEKGSLDTNLTPPYKLDPKSDIKLQCQAAIFNVNITGSFNFVLVPV